MTLETLKRVHAARPFHPFTFRLADGRMLSVPRPESLAFNHQGRTAIVITENEGWEFVDLSQVVSLEFEGEPAESQR